MSAMTWVLVRREGGRVLYFCGCWTAGPPYYPAWHADLRHARRYPTAEAAGASRKEWGLKCSATPHRTS